jgi:hypothetical protein
MATATQPQVTTPAPAIQVSSKLTTGIVALLTLQVQLGNKFESLATQTAADMKQFGYDRKKGREMLTAAFEKAHREQAKKDRIPEDQMNAHIGALLQKSAPDISKIMTLASPKDEAAAIELQKAKEAGLGLNKQLEIARGNTTVAAIEAERQNKAAGASKETARPQGNAPATVQPPAPESAATAKLTPKERIGTQFVAFVKWAESLGLEKAEVYETLSDLIADAEAALEKAEQK